MDSEAEVEAASTIEVAVVAVVAVGEVVVVMVQGVTEGAATLEVVAVRVQGIGEDEGEGNVGEAETGVIGEEVGVVVAVDEVVAARGLPVLLHLRPRRERTQRDRLTGRQATAYRALVHTHALTSLRRPTWYVSDLLHARPQARPVP